MPTLLQLQKIKDSYFIFYKKLRFIDFDAKYLNEIPFVFKPLTPPIHFAKSMILDINSYLGLPWWLVLMISAFFVRVCIFPLVLIQMKKMSKFGPVWPILVHLKEGFKTSNFKRFTNIVSVYNIYKFISKSEKIRIRSIFIYNLAYYPLLITMVYAIRNVLGDPLLSDASFLYLNTLTDIDPYYILPTLTISIYYYNFERFITPQNKNTLISKIRSACQIFLILWYPFLCCWPSGIVLYMMTNALISVVQSNLMKSQWFYSKINKKILHYNIMLSTMEYEKGTADSIIEAIKTGEESIKEKGIQETILVSQTNKMIESLNKQSSEVRDKKGHQ